MDEIGKLEQLPRKRQRFQKHLERERITWPFSPYLFLERVKEGAYIIDCKKIRGTVVRRILEAQVGQSSIKHHIAVSRGLSESSRDMQATKLTVIDRRIFVSCGEVGRCHEGHEGKCNESGLAVHFKACGVESGQSNSTKTRI